MQHRTHHVIAIALALGLAVAGGDAVALDFSAAPAQSGAVFNDVVTPTRDGSSLFTSNGVNPDNQSGFATHRHAVNFDAQPREFHMDEFGKEGRFHEEGMPISPVPELSEYVLLACGLAVLSLYTTRRKAYRGFSAA